MKGRCEVQSMQRLDSRTKSVISISDKLQLHTTAHQDNHTSAHQDNHTSPHIKTIIHPHIKTIIHLHIKTIIHHHNTTAKKLLSQSISICRQMLTDLVFQNKHYTKHVYLTRQLGHEPLQN